MKNDQLSHKKLISLIDAQELFKKDLSIEKSPDLLDVFSKFSCEFKNITNKNKFLYVSEGMGKTKTCRKILRESLHDLISFKKVKKIKKDEK
jgi:hypothetical protein